MTREIKFRAFDGEKMRYDVTGLEHGDANEMAGIFLDGDYYPMHSNPVMQYTGVKDKNGVEIYEGDVLQFSDKWEWYRGEFKARWYRAKHARLDTKGEVKFADGWFYIYDDPDGQDRLGVPVHNCYSIEVIGNIHENLELLEAK